MNQHFFNPEKSIISENIILVPYIPGPGYPELTGERPVRKKRILGSTLFSFGTYDVLTGFIGYSNLLTLLEFIAEVRLKNVYFVGTAGSLNPEFNHPDVIEAGTIYPGSVFTTFFENRCLQLKSSRNKELKRGTGITIDLIQRENPGWFREVTAKEIDFAEMELYPLRWYLGKPFSAYVVLSDQISESGISTFKRTEVVEQLLRIFSIIKVEIK